MDDLSSLDWSDTKAPGQNQPLNRANGNYYPTLRPTPPISGRSTPQVSYTAPVQGASKALYSSSRASTPANDSFASLVSFNAAQPKSNLSLQEQQRARQRYEEEQESERRRHLDQHFGAPSGGGLSNGTSTPGRIAAPPTHTGAEEYGGQRQSYVINKPFARTLQVAKTGEPVAAGGDENEEDILAAFNASAPVNTSSHMTYPRKESSDGLDLHGASLLTNGHSTRTNGNQANSDDDDPFGLGMGQTNECAPKVSAEGANAPEEDDVLGLLSRPVTDFTRVQAKAKESEKLENPSSVKDHAVAELVDMGFPHEKSVAALKTTHSGTDVQEAVGWLLSQAHANSKTNTRQNQVRDGVSVQKETDRRSGRSPLRRTGSSTGGTRPVWMKEEERASSGRRRQDDRSPANKEKDPAQYASELGSSLFKTAGSLWKTGAKKLNQAVSEFNSDGDPRQPKWMKEDRTDLESRKPRSRQHDGDDFIPKESGIEKTSEPDVTDEALMLESGPARPLRKATSRAPSEALKATSQAARDTIEPSTFSSPKRTVPKEDPRYQAQARDPRMKLNRQLVEEEAAQAYISPARRKKNLTKPETIESQPNPEPDLLFGNSSIPPKSAAPKADASTIPEPLPERARPIPSRRIPPNRKVPHVTPMAMGTSLASRKAGTAAFKRGDYAEATTHYSTALRALPEQHLLTIPLLANRALTNQKTGDPKASITDAESCLSLIGPSRGIGESVLLGDEDGEKPMDIYWGKAMTRKAEALEHLERWNDAMLVWRLCVEAGVGGALSIAGRNRCEDAVRPKPKPSSAAIRKTPSRPKPSALNDLGPSTALSTEAVTRLRAANAAADKLDDEKFALADRVDGRVTAWKGGKEGNLRALLASLENVLWEGAGWKKTGMGELIQVNKVKIVYMRGIGRVHPDKLPTTATTEQKMISAAVFATLNEAWERFKADNNL